MKDVVTNRCSAICSVRGGLLVCCKVTLSDGPEGALVWFGLVWFGLPEGALEALRQLTGDSDENLVGGDVLGGVVHHRHGLKMSNYFIWSLSSNLKVVPYRARI